MTQQFVEPGMCCATVGAQQNALLRCVARRDSAAWRVVYFPHAGAGASAARPLAVRVPEDCELLAVQLPGREDRYAEAPFASLNDAATAVALALGELPRLRTSFFGHSFGAILAFETAHRLRRRRELCKLIVAGHDAPSVARRPRDWHALDDPSLMEALRTLGGTHTAVLDHEELMRLTLPVIRNDLKMLEEYVDPRTEPLTIDLTALAGRADNETTDAGIDAWRDATNGRFTSRWFPGGHFFPLFQAEAIARLLIHDGVNGMDAPTQRHGCTKVESATSTT